MYGPTSDTHIRNLVWAMNQGSCVKCDAILGGVWHVDHIVPRSRGGIDHMSNYQPLCVTCNTSKGDGESIDYRPAQIVADYPSPEPTVAMVIHEPGALAPRVLCRGKWGCHEWAEPGLHHCMECWAIEWKEEGSMGNPFMGSDWALAAKILAEQDTTDHALQYTIFMHRAAAERHKDEEGPNIWNELVAEAEQDLAESRWWVKEKAARVQEFEAEAKAEAAREAEVDAENAAYLVAMQVKRDAKVKAAQKTAAQAAEQRAAREAKREAAKTRLAQERALAILERRRVAQERVDYLAGCRIEDRLRKAKADAHQRFYAGGNYRGTNHHADMQRDWLLLEKQAEVAGDAWNWDECVYVERRRTWKEWILR